MTKIRTPFIAGTIDTEFGSAHIEINRYKKTSNLAIQLLYLDSSIGVSYRGFKLLTIDDNAEEGEVFLSASGEEYRKKLIELGILLETDGLAMKVSF